MPWFEGSIPDAVATAKSRKAIFVVFVEGPDEASRSTLATLRSEEIGAKLQSEDFIVIKIDSNGESFRQFSQIYHLVPVPSVFFIGANGVPLEVVAGNVASADLLRRIDDVLSRSGKATPQSSTSSFIASESAASASATSTLPSTSTGREVSAQMLEEETVRIPPQGEESPAPEPPPRPSPSTATAAAIPEEAAGGQEEAVAAPAGTDQGGAEVSVEERVARAQALLEAKRAQRREEEERAQREHEVERRRAGQEAQKAKRLHQEQEAAQAADAIKKERLFEQQARQRVLQQIEQDKAERAARQSQVRAQEESKAQEEKKRRDMQAAARAAEGARVQFRLPDGSTHTHMFPPETPLSDVRSYASSNLNLPFRDFGMSMTFPRREFTAEDNTRTVTELELCPTAVILILPAHRGEVVSAGTSGVGSTLTQWLWTLLTPLLSIYAYVRGFLFANPRPPPPAAAAAPPQASEGPPGDNGGPAVRRRRGVNDGSGVSIRRQGNIHRLSNRQDSSDDDNNTWNGNSTQQM